MRYGVVEGEPGIFPDPVARVLRALGRLVSGRKQGREPADVQPDAPPAADQADDQARDEPGESPTR